MAFAAHRPGRVGPLNPERGGAEALPMARHDSMVRLFAAGHLRPGEVILGVFRGRSTSEVGRRERRWVVVSTQRVLCFSCIGRTFQPRALLGAVARSAIGPALPFELPDPMTGEVDRITCEDAPGFLALAITPGQSLAA